ncbi:MAG: alpha-hydroxy-acid oxidizing protein [Treponema sp.]|nr:alpha-hydroxy-acid oxidizing protein [Treponema sp.]
MEHNAGDSPRITREYLDSLLVEMRHIDSVSPSTTLNLYGEIFRTPVMLAALSHLSGTHPEGMVEAARGIVSAGAVMWTGMGSEEELEKIIAVGAKTIKIIKPHSKNEDIFRKIKHAEECGCLAIGMDVDHQFGGKNSWYSAGGLPMGPKTLDEIKSFVKATKLPFIIKGVLSVQDAEKCLEAGAGGIVVSHHHGMVDYAIPPLRILPAIAEKIKGRIPVFIDCGIDRGMDAFKALALGATAVSTGRAIMGPLAGEGAPGVSRKIDEMTDELKWAMAVTCSPDLNHIDSSLIWPPGRNS